MAEAGIGVNPDLAADAFAFLFAAWVNVHF